jgi:hypothetical protein
MALYLSDKEINKRLRRLISMLEDLRRQRASIGKMADNMANEGQTASTISTTISGLLTDWASNLSQVITELSAVPTTWQPYVKVGMPGMYNSAVIEAANQANLNDAGIPSALVRPDATCEVNQVSPFAIFAAGDIVSISNAENYENDLTMEVQHTPESAGSEKIQNGKFNNATPATYWTETGDGGTEIVITSGACTFTNATAVLSQTKTDMVAGTWPSGTRYIVTFVLSDVSAGTLAIGTNANAAIHTVTANGEHRVLVTADNNAAGLKFTATGFTGVLTSVSAIPMTGLTFNGPLGRDNDADSSLVITLQER